MLICLAKGAEYISSKGGHCSIWINNFVGGSEDDIATTRIETFFLAAGGGVQCLSLEFY